MKSTLPIQNQTTIEAAEIWTYKVKHPWKSFFFPKNTISPLTKMRILQIIYFSVCLVLQVFLFAPSWSNNCWTPQTPLLSNTPLTCDRMGLSKRDSFDGSTVYNEVISWKSACSLLFFEGYFHFKFYIHFILMLLFGQVMKSSEPVPDHQSISNVCTEMVTRPLHLFNFNAR